MKRYIWHLFFILLCIPSFAQKPKITRVDPPNWWVGMPIPELELMFYGENLGETEVTLDKEDGSAQIVEVFHAENPNYLFVKLMLDATLQPGAESLVFRMKNQDSGKEITYAYELRSRSQEANRIAGLNSSDLIYLIMPDRFANGDPGNDVDKKANETELDRNEMFKRHGGDLKGITNHLDYLKDLGATALWLNPVQENNQPATSYHGYAITDHYAIDTRLGDQEDYLQLEKECRNRNMKLIMDVVYNHVGNEHFFIRDLPEKDWIHQHDEFTKTNYRAPVLLDPYAAEQDKKIMSDGWFDKHMPDLNQQNPRVANYLFQNNVWWIETAGIDALRIDTYAYSDLRFMEETVQKLKICYPNLGIFGETWVHGTPIQAFFADNKMKLNGINSTLPGVTDFQLNYAISEALNGNFGWTDGVNRLYYTMAKDYMYEDPSRNVLFLDNHDVSRFYSVVGEDFAKYKMGIAWLMTCRGIPMIYYGTEILMKNYADPDGKVREDFPGGWAGDATNKFNASGRTAEENEAFNYVQTLANWRRNTPVVQSGKTMQFIPEDGVYVYFRYDKDAAVMVIMNSNSENKTLKLNRFQERFKGYKSAKDVTTGKKMELGAELTAPGKTTWVLELGK